MKYVRDDNGTHIISEMPDSMRVETSAARMETIAEMVDVPDPNNPEQMMQQEITHDVHHPAVIEEKSGAALFEWMKQQGRLPQSTQGKYYLFKDGDPIPAGPFRMTDWEQGSWVDVIMPPTDDMVNTERDRRKHGGFEFAGQRFQSREDDLVNISGAVTASGLAEKAGAPREGFLRWHGGDEDFAWTTEDNKEIPMDIATVEAFGITAMKHVSACMKAARMLKNMPEIPADYMGDQYWP